MRSRVVPALAATLAFTLSACVSGSDDLGLTPQANVGSSSQQTAAYQPVVEQSTLTQPAAVPQVVSAPTVDQSYASVPAAGGLETTASVVSTHSGTELSVPQPYPDIYSEPMVDPIPRTRKTYLLNGLASAVPFIGYGFTNLSKKIPGSRLYSYATPLEGSTVIRSAVMKDIVAAHAIDPNVEINLIGISYGVNVATSIASELDRKGIAVHYLGTVDGPMPAKIKPNVKTADNFVCTNVGCIGAPLRLKPGNNTTQVSSFKIRSGHIPLGNNKDVHNRILQQIEG